MNRNNKKTPSVDFSDVELEKEEVFVDPSDTKAFLNHHYTFRFNIVKHRVEVYTNNN